VPSVNLLTNGIGDVNRGGQLVPTGTVFSFAGSTAPTGWLLCDGSAYNQADYTNLFSALGSTYNTQVNPTTGSTYTTTAGQFRVPDLRGLFLRGVGTPLGQSAVTLGGHQAQTTAKNGLTNSNSEIRPPGQPTGGSQTYYVTAGTTGSGTSSNSIGLALAQTITGDPETRPMNRGVTYIIKI
jgi:hypothetical protein